MAHDVFISYSTRDKAIANAVCAGMEQARIRCWMAPRDVLPSQDWGKAIMDAILASRVLVVVFSSSSNASGQVLREVERAVRREVPILPFRIEDFEPTGSMEYHLATVHWLDAMTPPLEQHIARLVDDIERLLDRKRPDKGSADTASEADGEDDSAGAKLAEAERDEPVDPRVQRIAMMPLDDLIKKMTTATQRSAPPTPVTGGLSFDTRTEMQIRAQARRDVAGSAEHRRRLEDVIARRDAMIAAGQLPPPYTSSRELLREVFS